MYAFPMIVVEMKGTVYRCISAFLENADEQIQCTVTTGEEVASYLKAHPDQFFSLVSGLVQTLEGEAPDEDLVWCGLVKWKTREQKLHNKRFDFDEDGLSNAELDGSSLFCRPS
jgi:hypothetical protein